MATVTVGQNRPLTYYTSSKNGLRTLIKHSLEAAYFDTFNFYFSKPINEILSEAHVPHSLLFRDYLFYDVEETSMRRWYTKEESDIRLTNYTAFYAEIDKKYYPNVCVTEQRKIMSRRHYYITKLKREIQRRIENNQMKEERSQISEVRDKILDKLDRESHYLIDFKESEKSDLTRSEVLLKDISTDGKSYESKLHDIYNPQFSSQEVDFSRPSSRVSLRSSQELKSFGYIDQESWSGFSDLSNLQQLLQKNKDSSANSDIFKDGNIELMSVSGRDRNKGMARKKEVYTLGIRGSDEKEASLTKRNEDFQRAAKEFYKNKYSESSDTRDKRSNIKIDSNAASISNFRTTHQEPQKIMIKNIKSPSINISDLLTKSHGIQRVPAEKVINRQMIYKKPLEKSASKAKLKVPILELERVRKSSENSDKGITGRKKSSTRRNISKGTKSKKMSKNSSRVKIKSDRRKKKNPSSKGYFKRSKPKLKTDRSNRKFKCMKSFKKSKGGTTCRASVNPVENESLNSYIRKILRRQKKGKGKNGLAPSNSNHLFTLKTKQNPMDSVRESHSFRNSSSIKQLLKNRKKFLKDNANRLNMIKKKFDNFEYKNLNFDGSNNILKGSVTSRSKGRKANSNFETRIFNTSRFIYERGNSSSRKKKFSFKKKSSCSSNGNTSRNKKRLKKQNSAELAQKYFSSRYSQKKKSLKSKDSEKRLSRKKKKYSHSISSSKFLKKSKHSPSPKIKKYIYYGSQKLKTAAIDEYNYNFDSRKGKKKSGYTEDIIGFRKRSEPKTLNPKKKNSKIRKYIQRSLSRNKKKLSKKSESLVYCSMPTFKVKEALLLKKRGFAATVLFNSGFNYKKGYM